MKRFILILLIFNFSIFGRLTSPRPLRQYWLDSYCQNSVCTEDSIDKIKNKKDMTLTDLDLSGFKFQDITIEGLTFKRSNLMGANFEGSTLSGTTFKGVENFQGVSFEGATFLNGTAFQDCDLTDVSFNGVKFKGAVNFTGSTNLDFNGAFLFPDALITLPSGGEIYAKELYGCYSGCNVFEHAGSYYTYKGISKIIDNYKQQEIRIKNTTLSTHEIWQVEVENFGRALVSINNKSKTDIVVDTLNGIGLDINNMYDFLHISRERFMNLNTDEFADLVYKRIEQLKESPETQVIKNGDTLVNEYKGINLYELDRQFKVYSEDPEALETLKDYYIRLEKGQLEPLATRSQIQPLLDQIAKDSTEFEDFRASTYDYTPKPVSTTPTPRTFKPKTVQGDGGSVGSLVNQADSLSALEEAFSSSEGGTFADAMSSFVTAVQDKTTQPDSGFTLSDVMPLAKTYLDPNESFDWESSFRTTEDLIEAMQDSENPTIQALGDTLNTAIDPLRVGTE